MLEKDNGWIRQEGWEWFVSTEMIIKPTGIDGGTTLIMPEEGD